MTTHSRIEDLLDKAYWGWDPAKIPNAPVSALRGVSEADGDALAKSLNIHTIRDFATSRFVLAAQELLARASAPVAPTPPAAPTPSPAAPATPVPAPETFEQMLARVAGEAGLSTLPLIITEAEVKAQLARYGGSTNFEQAFRTALTTILTNGEDIESPLALFREEYPNDPNVAGTLKGYLNRSTARLALIRIADFDEDTQQFFPPEHGETLEDGWAFSLYIGDFSDHGYWAIIPRPNPSTGYIYGFN